MSTSRASRNALKEITVFVLISNTTISLKHFKTFLFVLNLKKINGFQSNNVTNVFSDNIVKVLQVQVVTEGSGCRRLRRPIVIVQHTLL